MAFSTNHLLVCVWIFVMAFYASLTNSRHVDTHSWMQTLPEENSDFETPHTRVRRGIYDSSCKGIHDPRLFSDLERICDDCYNLYRNRRVAIECRDNCFTNPKFDFCVKNLDLDVKEYRRKAKDLRNHRRNK